MVPDDPPQQIHAFFFLKASSYPSIRSQKSLARSKPLPTMSQAARFPLSSHFPKRSSFLSISSQTSELTLPSPFPRSLHNALRFSSPWHPSLPAPWFPCPYLFPLLLAQSEHSPFPNCLLSSSHWKPVFFLHFFVPLIRETESQNH